MERCGSCGRRLLVGEVFRLYRRRLRGVVVVCALCRLHAGERGWVPVVGPVYRQQSRRAKVAAEREVATSDERLLLA